MPQQIGSLDSTGSPRLKISISGVLTNTPVEFDVIIDTGFNGFVSMPLLTAFPLGLPLFGTTSVMLADGTTASKLTALGRAELGPETKIGIVILEPNSSDILVGMEFLRSFEKVLLLHPQKPFVILEDCKIIDAALLPAKEKDDAPAPTKGT